MNLNYNSNELMLVANNESITLSDLYKGQPVYVYNLEGIKERYEAFKNSFNGKVDIHYAVKANTHRDILSTLAQLGAGADVVSIGEIEQCLEAGFLPETIVYSGVGKSKMEIEKAVKLGIKEINVEGPQELERISEITKRLNKPAHVSLRMNPDVCPDTHPYIRTGFRENKFGMDESFLPELIKTLKSNPLLVLKGLSIHIGSQILETKSYCEAVKKMWPVFEKLKSEGFQLETFNVGGGLGIQYETQEYKKDFQLMQEFGQAMLDVFKDQNLKILCEPGRMLVGPEGILLCEVEYIKSTPYKNFAIVNTGMHHLIRPALYQSFHKILATQQNLDREEVLYDIVGPICESSDVIGTERTMRELKQGDLLAILDTGAYGATMQSRYNSQVHVLEVVI